MKTVTNKTNAPIKVPLARNQILRLGPGNSGQVNDPDSERPAVLKMVEAGEIEISDGDGGAGKSGPRGSLSGKTGRSSGGAIGRRGGDR
jgi:uncharacterized membrane protein YgcG